MQGDRVPPEQWRQMQADNARQIDNALTALESNYNLGFLAEMGRSFSSGDEINFTELWTEIKAIQELFASLKPLQNDARSELWERFNRFRNRAREAQDAWRSRRDAELDSNYNQVNSALLEMQSTYELDVIGQYVNNVYGPTKGFREDADNVRSLLSSLKFRREQRQELWQWLDKMWSVIKMRQEQKQADWRKEQQDYIYKLEIRLDNQRDYLNKQYARRDSLNDQLDNARGDAFRDRVQGWIAEADEKIASVQNDIEELQEKIRSKRDRL